MECPVKGLKCSNETVNPTAGFYWRWKTEEHHTLYQRLKDNLNVLNNSYDRRYTRYNKSFPPVYQCPLPDSCLGGMNAECATGYTGPLCYKIISSCQRCHSLPWLIAQITIVLVAIAMVVIPVALGKKVQDSNGRSLTDIVLARLKIVIGFYQVPSGTLESFSYIRWPSTLMQLVKYAKILQLNLIQIAPVHCFSSGVNVNSYTILTLFTTVVVLTSASAILIYWLKNFVNGRYTI